MSAAALVECLEGMARAAAGLVEATEQVHQALVRGQVDALEGALRRQEQLAAELTAAEARRRALVAVLARDLGCDEEELPATAVAQRLRQRGEADWATQLVEAAARVASLLERVARLNAQNRALARQGLASVRAVWEALADMHGYGPATPAGTTLRGTLRVDRRA